jgi:protein-S-isoprenylcysteine O-methyltransferase Ste14
MLQSTGFVWILFAVGLYGVLHSLLASHTAKRWAARMLGEGWVRRWYRLVFSSLGGLTLLPVLYLVRALPDRTLYSIPLPWAILTGLVQLAAAAALLWTVMQTGAMNFIGFEQALDPASAERPRPLVSAGMYRYVRHPLYFLGLVVIWLTPVMTANILALNLGVTAYLLLGSLLEENKLRDDLGPAYEEYRSRTPWMITLPPRRRGPVGG